VEKAIQDVGRVYLNWKLSGLFLVDKKCFQTFLGYLKFVKFHQTKAGETEISSPRLSEVSQPSAQNHFFQTVGQLSLFYTGSQIGRSNEMRFSFDRLMIYNFNWDSSRGHKWLTE
jgi:hypothetical protein